MAPSVSAVGDEEHGRVREKHEEEAEGKREGKPERRDQRWEDGIENGHDGRDEQCAPEALDGRAGDDVGGRD